MTMLRESATTVPRGPGSNEPARDVVVVGGGPAGLAAAAAAAREGAATMLVEAAPTFGQPVRTTGGSWPADLEPFGLDASVWHPVRNCELWSARRTVRFSSSQTVGCVLDVPAAWGMLADRARLLGAELRTGVSGGWGGLAPDSVLVELHPREGGPASVPATVAIDATGHRGALVREARVARAPCRVGVGVEETIEAPGWDQSTIVLAMGDVAPAGYGWLFPEGGGRVRLGVGVTRPGAAGTPVDLLHGWLERDPRLAAVRGGRVLSRQGGTIPIRSHQPPPVADRLLVAGDAGGSISLLAGEGIRFALQAGDLAGQAAAEAAAGDRVGASHLRARYARRWDREHGRMLRRGDRVYRRAVTLSEEQWSAVLERASRLSPEELATLVRGDLSLGFLARLYWRTLRPRRAEGVRLGGAGADPAEVAHPRQLEAGSAGRDHGSSAASACGCRDRCDCGDRRATYINADRGRLLPRVIESMRRLSPSARPVRLCRPESSPAGRRGRRPSPAAKKVGGRL